jgi:hypothetical protein
MPDDRVFTREKCRLQFVTTQAGSPAKKRMGRDMNKFLAPRLGEPKKTLTDPMRYYDPKYYEAAKR